MAKVLAGLFAAGATLALLTVALPHSAHASTAGLLLVVGEAYAIAAALYWQASSVRPRMLPLALACGTTSIGAVAYFSGITPSPLIFFFLWVFIYCAYFFSNAQSALQIAYVGAVYGCLLGLRTPPGGIAVWWLVGMGTLVVAAAVIRSMRQRTEELLARVYGLARSDPLTGLSNRRGFREVLDVEVERARRAGTSLSLIVGDVDHLKEVSDRAGARAAEAVIVRLARILEADRRNGDAIARVAEGQIALILPDADIGAAFLIADAIRDELCKELACDVVPTTISFGVAGFPEHGATAGSLVRAADQALAAAKHAGRNRTAMFSRTLAASSPELGRRDIGGERFLAAVLDLAEAVDLRFSGSARHSETVGRYAEMLARELGLTEARIQRVRLAGILHDVGKVTIPDTILQKPGPLTEEEFEIVKKHPALGAQILEHPSLADVRSWVGAHHERPDGRGYPLALSGEQIPIEARILSVADAYEAMTSDRSYRAATGHSAARAELERCSGRQFDPQVADALLRILDREGKRVEDELALR